MELSAGSLPGGRCPRELRCEWIRGLGTRAGLLEARGATVVGAGAGLGARAAVKTENYVSGGLEARASLCVFCPVWPKERHQFTQIVQELYPPK